MPRPTFIAAVLLLALCAGPKAERAGPADPHVTDEDRQRVLRRIELYTGGLTGDSAIALEQMARRDETAELAARLPNAEPPVKELRAALERFDLDVERAATDAATKLGEALARTRGLADATVPLEDARLQLTILRVRFGTNDPRYKEGVEAYRRVAEQFSDEPLPTSFTP